MTFEPQVINVTVNDDNVISVNVAEEEVISVNTDVTVVHAIADYYEGPYTATPQAREIVLETNGKLLSDNIVIAPIPSNYGLVTWNGAVLRIS